MNFRAAINAFFAKDSQARIALSVNKVGKPQETPANYEAYARKGYQKNVVVYRCIDLIAQACGGICWDVYSRKAGMDKATELPDHPLKKLFDRPNPMMAQSQFIQNVVGYYKLTGNTYIEQNQIGKKPPVELWPDRPDRMKIVPNARGYVARYEFTANGVTKKFEVDPVTLLSTIIHMKTFNPTDDWYGQSPLQAALMALDQSNAGNTYNLALQQNSATPSGVLQVVRTEYNKDGSLDPKQFAQLKEDFDNTFTGVRNAGRPLILQGGMAWQQIAISPKDMEYLKSKEVTEIDICNAFGVPPELLGLGQKTFKNYAEARLALYEEVVLPMMDVLKTEFNHALTPQFGDGIYLDYDRDDIEALAIKREAKFASVKDASFLTQNEKREAAGYPKIEGWDVFLIGQRLMETPENEELEVTNETEENPTSNEPTLEPTATSAEENEDSEDEGKGIEFKVFNRITDTEKQRTLKRAKRARNSLAAPFERDLKADFDDMAEDMEKAVLSSTDPRSQEYSLLKVLDKHTPAIEKTMKRHIRYSVDEFGKNTFRQAKELFINLETKAKPKWEDWAIRYVNNHTAKNVTEIMNTSEKMVRRVIKRLTREAVVEGISNPEVAKELRKEFEDLSVARSRTIARNEVKFASENASLEAAKSLQVPGMMKTWVAPLAGNRRDGGKDGNGPNHQVMNEQEVPIDSKFSVPPDTDMEGPGDVNAPADQVINCDCVLVFRSGNNGEL